MVLFEEEELACCCIGWVGWRGCTWEFEGFNEVWGSWEFCFWDTASCCSLCSTGVFISGWATTLACFWFVGDKFTFDLFKPFETWTEFIEATEDIEVLLVEIVFRALLLLSWEWSEELLIDWFDLIDFRRKIEEECFKTLGIWGWWCFVDEEDDEEEEGVGAVPVWRFDDLTGVVRLEGLTNCGCTDGETFVGVEGEDEFVDLFELEGDFGCFSLSDEVLDLIFFKDLKEYSVSKKRKKIRLNK